MSNNNYCSVKSPSTFQDFLTTLEVCSEAPDNFRVLYRGQSNKKWKLNSTLARPITEVPQPLRRIVAYSELRGYFERNRPSDELLDWEKKGPEPFNHPKPHKNPHSHLIEYEIRKNKKFEIINERIYPIDVKPE